MSLFKCKMCGGDLEILDGSSVAECEYCGTKQTVPKSTNENLQTLFNRANALRLKSEFDKAEKIYEKIIEEEDTQAEAYWGLLLCRYGIEYVDDPVTYKKVPTCHRASYDSILADEDYQSALSHADAVQRILYEEQAREIDRIQKEIIALAQRQEQYDVFICYKETDEYGKRTQDSVIANDIYHHLTEAGFKVFYAAITLEGKLGSAYEPIIFAALNSAKVMLVVGTKPQYFNAVWVKNEWSRFLKILKQDHSKLLIPCYRGMDAYELPEEFSYLQALDMGNIGFVQDLIRGIKKIVPAEQEKINVEPKSGATAANATLDSYLERAFIFLEDGDFERGDEYLEKVLDIDPRCAKAYLGKLMIDLCVTKQRNLAFVKQSFEENNNYKRLIRYGSDDLIDEINLYLNEVKAGEEIRKAEEAMRMRQQAQQQKAAERKAQMNAAQVARAEERERVETQFSYIAQQYSQIPSDANLKKMIKARKPIKSLAMWAVVLLFLYWPVAIVLFAVRANKIKTAMSEEKQKYDAIRTEYYRLLSLKQQYL